VIKAKHLVPGRVIAELSWKQVPVFNKHGWHMWNNDVRVWTPCMVISFVPRIERRHARKEADVEHCDVLVFWFDDRQRRLDSVSIPLDRDGWKVLW
jgi:hypothetical protein